MSKHVIFFVAGILAARHPAAWDRAVDRWHWLDDRSQYIAGVTVLMAGVYQFTPLKYKCLDQCRSPMGFITGHWHGSRERIESFKLGVHHGVFCVGCCWALMGVLFVVGVMNLAWVAALTVFILIEKFGGNGPLIARVGGIAMIAFGVFVIAS